MFFKCWLYISLSPCGTEWCNCKTKKFVKGIQPNKCLKIHMSIDKYLTNCLCGISYFNDLLPLQNCDLSSFALSKVTYYPTIFTLSSKYSIWWFLTCKAHSSDFQTMLWWWYFLLHINTLYVCHHCLHHFCDVEIMAENQNWIFNKRQK